jgi:aspartyl-tRNA(Asn)/glutamyl-tRNA(Gln) amidotransferase subunit A
MDIHTLTIKEAKEKLSNRKISAVELTQAFLERIDQVDSMLNAFMTITREYALAQAKQADSLIARGEDKALLGIPLSIKDNFCTQGIRTTASSKVLDGFVPPYDATVISHLAEAGAVTLGKTNMDAWAHGSSTATSDYGPSRNPWNIEHYPGGSSGGAAVSVASSESLAAMGTETAGSVRGPACWTGLVGLKPTYGRVSRYGVIAMASSTDSPGPLTKTVEDAARILEVIAGVDEHDATSSMLPVEMYSQTMKAGKKMTIGISDDYFEGVSEAVAVRVHEALRLLESKGHTLKKINLFDPSYAIDVYTILMRSEVSSNLARYDGIRYGNNRSYFGEEAKRRIMLGTYALSSGYYDAYYKKAQQVRTLIVQDFARAFTEVDVIIGPTLPTTAPRIGEASDPMFGEKADILTEPSAIAGLCGINMPVGFSPDGLPVGMQIIGPQFGESIILDLAYQYECETQFWRQKPSI